MKNELGIEKKCENCHFCYGKLCDDDYYCRREKGNPKKDFKSFTPSFQAYEARIKELQEQLSNSMVILDEKEFIKTMKNRLEGWNGKIQKIDNTILEIAKSKTQECNNWFNTHQNKKKIEQTLKNLEGKFKQ